jgi:hypothetical protein
MSQVGDTAEDLNTIFSQKDCFVNVSECDLELLLQREFKEKVRAKKIELMNRVNRQFNPQYHKYRNSIPFSGKFIK